MLCVNVNTTDATTGATALLLIAVTARSCESVMQHSAATSRRFRGGVVGGHALGSWWARLLEAVVVLDLLGHDVRALEVFHGELAVGERGGMVLKEVLEAARASVELANLVEEAFDVGVVVVRPNDWDAVGGDGDELVDGVG